MTKRFSVALAHAADDRLEVLCDAISQAQREIFSDGAGSDQVRTDPAVGLVMIHLYDALKVTQMDSDFSGYTEVTEHVDAKIKQDDRQEAAFGRWRDAQSAQAGAVNVGALASAISRHARAMAEAGITDEAIRTDKALMAICHQMASLCGVGGIGGADPGLRERCEHACRSAVAADAARGIVAEVDVAKAPALSAP